MKNNYKSANDFQVLMNLSEFSLVFLGLITIGKISLFNYLANRLITWTILICTPVSKNLRYVLQVNQNMATVSCSNFKQMFSGIKLYGLLVLPG